MSINEQEIKAFIEEAKKEGHEFTPEEVKAAIQGESEISEEDLNGTAGGMDEQYRIRKMYEDCMRRKLHRGFM